MKNNYCVELQNVVKSFKNVKAVNHISVKVEQGKVFSLLGPSGCGKTTTLRLIAGLETLDEGNILIDGNIVNDIPPYRRDCSTVFQNLALFPHMTIEENMAYGLERRKIPRTEINKRVANMLKLMGLTDKAKRRPSQLSGGQQQRVALGRSLVLNPKILLLDEPLASLDRKLRKEMQIELKRIQQEVGITFLYVTHDQKVALSISDIIAVIKDGKIEQIGFPRDIYEKPRTRFVADFMGASNIFLGDEISYNNKKIKLKTKSGLVISALLNKEIQNDKIIAFKGKIIKMVYQGDFIEMVVSLDKTGELITAHIMSSSLRGKNHFAPNKEVFVHWNIESSNVLFS